MAPMDGLTSGPNHFLERSSRGDDDFSFEGPWILSSANADSSCLLKSESGEEEEKSYLSITDDSCKTFYDHR
ncbi:hypothetical protein TMatcc_002605 [Talaromyces marneffei ATCC 18224]